LYENGSPQWFSYLKLYAKYWSIYTLVLYIYLIIVVGIQNKVRKMEEEKKRHINYVVRPYPYIYMWKFERQHHFFFFFLIDLIVYVYIRLCLQLIYINNFKSLIFHIFATYLTLSIYEFYKGNIFTLINYLLSKSHENLAGQHNHR
jgi:hypothetical protein